MLKVKNVNRLKVFGFKEEINNYTKNIGDTVIFVDRANGNIDFDGNSKVALDEIFELVAANLIKRVN